MGYNIGPKIGIDGEAQFRQQIKAINNEYKTLQAQTKALTAEYDKNGNQQGKLKMQTQQLEKQIDAQKQAIAEMEKALAKAENTTDANADAVTTWRGKLYNAQATVAQLEKELADTEDELRKMEKGIQDSGDAADAAGGAVSDFGDILGGNLVADVILDGLREAAGLVEEIAVDSVGAAAGLRAETAQFAQTFGEMEQAATQALKAVEDRTGISATRIKGNFSTVYAFAKTMGSDSAQALDIASRAMAAAADNAAYYDKTVEEVTESIQAYIKGNYANDAALGIASTETTRNAAALERYGKAFKELTENQKVDTLLAMVEAGNKASGAMGQAAREAGEWTNVTGELEDAQRQLLAVIGEPVLEAAIPVVQEFTQALRDMAQVSPGEQLRRDIDGFAATLEKTEQTYNATMATTLAQATLAERYVRQLQELEKQGVNTAQAHAEYEAVVTKLNAVMPQLNVTLNEQTGLINQNTAALLGDVAAWKEAATTQAMYDKMKGQLEAYGQMQVKVAEGNHQIALLEEDREAKLLELSNLLGTAEATRIEFERKAIEQTAIDYYTLYDKFGNVIYKFSDALGTEQTATLKLAKAIHATDQDIAGLESSVKDANAVIAEYDSEMNELTEVVKKHREATDGLTEEQRKQQQAITETQARLLELKEAYQAARDSTRAMLDSSIGLWDTVAKKSEWTAQKVLQNWRDQMKAFDQYSANLKKAEDMGLDDGIIKALSDGKQESMQILDALVNQSKHSVGEINAAFTDLNLSKDGTVDVLMDMQTELQEGYDKLVADARQAGLEIVDGIVQAIKDNAYKLDGVLQYDPVKYEHESRELIPILGEKTPVAWSYKQTGIDPNVAGTIQNFNITQLPGESGEEFAYRVADIIANDADWKGGGLGGR